MCRRAIGSTLIILGLLLLLGTGTLAAYSAYERYRFEQELAREELRDLSKLASMSTAESASSSGADGESLPPGRDPAAGVPSPSSSDEASPTPLSAATTTPTSVPVPTATATPRSIFPAQRIVIPAIEVDTRIVESPIVDGEWQVPKFVAGHLQGTAQPGEGSNAVFAGHLQSLTSGNVFANLDKLRPGDEVRLFTRAEELRYVVRESRLVEPTDLSVVAATTEETLMLITCAGTWNPIARDYSERLIVVATPAPPGQP